MIIILETWLLHLLATRGAPHLLKPETKDIPLGLESLFNSWALYIAFLLVVSFPPRGPRPVHHLAVPPIQLPCFVLPAA